MPVDTLTGALTDRKLHFRLTGPLELWWYMNYDSSRCQSSLSLGNGTAHDFDRQLTVSAEGIRYISPTGQSYDFAPLAYDDAQHALHGYFLRRLSQTSYRLSRHAEPAMEFEFPDGQTTTRLRRLVSGRQRIEFHYNPFNILEAIQDSANRRIRVAEQADRRLSSLTLEGLQGKPDVLLAAYQYDERGNLISATNGQGAGYAFAYDDNNRLMMRRGRKGFKFHFAYDKQGRCIRSVGDDRLYGVALDYVEPGRLTKVMRADLGVWSYHFDAAGRLSRVTDPLGGVEKIIRDELGQAVLDIDANGNTTRTVYDAAGAPVAKYDALGHRIAIPEDPNAPDPLAHRVAANAAEYEYGRLLDVSQIRLPSASQLQAMALPLTAASAVFTRSAEPSNSIVETPFAVRPLAVSWWPEPKLGRIFNEFGKLVGQRDEFGRQRRWTYDASGNAAEYVDFDGSKWFYDKGTWHLPRRIVDPLGAETRYGYATNDQISSFVDAGGTASEYRYDQKDHLIEVRRHGRIRDTYKRDAMGNLVSKNASDGRELLRLEIGFGNLPVKRVLSSGDEHSFQYDKNGRYLVAESKKDKVEFAYDSLGNTIAEKRNGLGIVARFQGWRRPLELLVFDRFPIRHEWKNSGLLAITDPSGKTHHFHFHGNGVVERRYSNGSSETSQYDGLGRCLFKHAQGNKGQQWTRRYHWSGEGKLRQVDDNIRGESRHEYDAAHRLKRRYASGQTEDYVMDQADNLLAKPGLVGAVFAEGNRIAAANGERYSYNDRNHVAGVETAGGVIRYTYDSRDQLVRTDMPTGVWTAEYDALGRRTRKTWAGQTTEFYWYDDQLIAELHADGSLRIYVYADPLALAPFMFLDYASRQDDPASGQQGFVFGDQIGTPCTIESAKGEKTWAADIAPYGSTQIKSDHGQNFDLRFPGHYSDAEIGLHYNRFRYYNPVLGRYLQSDPLGIAGGSNVYAYVVNPLRVSDVRGLDEDEGKAGRQKSDEEGTDKPAPKSEPDLSDLPTDVKYRIAKGDKKGRPFGSPSNPREPTTEELNPRIQNIPAGELASTMDPKHGIHDGQAAGVAPMSNEELIKFRPEDPISGTPKGDGLAQTGGHHRTAEIDRRVKSGEMPADTPVPVLIHD